MTPWQFVGSADSLFESAPGPYVARLRFLPPSKMKPGDMIVVLLVSDADRESVSLAGGKLVIESRTPGSGGSGCTVQMLTTAGAELLELDGTAMVRTRVKIGVSTWESQEALFNSSGFVRVKSRTGTGLIDGADMPQQQTTAFVSSGLPQAWASNVTWDYDDNFAATVGGVRVLRRVVTDHEPTEYTFDSVDTRLAIGSLLVYRGLAVAAMVGGSAVDFASAVSATTPTRATARTTDLFLGGAWIHNLDAAVTTIAMPASDAAVERTDLARQVSAVNVRRLQVFDFGPNVLGNVKKTVALTSSNPGMVFSIVLAGEQAKGRDLGWSPIVAGAIGLPTEGI